MLKQLASGRAIVFSIIAGFILGYLSFKLGYSEFASYIKPVGKVFIQLLKMMIVPLVFSSIFMAVINLGTPEKLKRIGLKALLYYFTTTCIAAFIGLIAVNLIQPGKGVDIGSLPTEKVSENLSATLKAGADSGVLKSVLKVLQDAIPTNPVAAFANADILQIIVFSIFLSLAALFFRKESEPLINIVASLEFLSLKLVQAIMLIAPFGIFALLFDVMAQSGLDVIFVLGKYVMTVVSGLLIHFIILAIIGGYLIKISPIQLIHKLARPILTAFSTASSAATLPLTMQTVEDNLNVDKETSKFVLPLGATINMDGTALYESVAVIFIGQVYGLDLSLTNQLIIFVTASLAAVGAAAIPQAGIVTMGIVLSAVGFPLDAIALILSVDRIVDMFRTAVNVFGDCIGACFVSFTKMNKTS